jgi:hypothetical protein
MVATAAWQELATANEKLISQAMRRSSIGETGPPVNAERIAANPSLVENVGYGDHFTSGS